MMKCRIKETGEIKYLVKTDRESGVDMEADIIGGHGGFIDEIFDYDEWNDVYDVAAEDFDWWENWIDENNEAENEIEELDFDLHEVYGYKDFGDKKVEEIMEELHRDYANYEMDAINDGIKNAVKEIRAKYLTVKES